MVPLATAFHEEQDRTVRMNFIEPHNGVVRLTWNRMMDVYSELLMVFLRIFRDSREKDAMTAFEQDLKQWRANAADITRQRNAAPTEPGPVSP